MQKTVYLCNFDLPWLKNIQANEKNFAMRPFSRGLENAKCKQKRQNGYSLNFCYRQADTPIPWYCMANIFMTLHNGHHERREKEIEKNEKNELRVLSEISIFFPIFASLCPFPLQSSSGKAQ